MGNALQSTVNEVLSDKPHSEGIVLEKYGSSTIFVSSGKPQSTVLGHILHLILINDLPGCICHSTLRLIAEDCLVIRLYVHTYMYNTYICMYVCMRVCVCMCVCVHMCMHMFDIHTCTVQLQISMVLNFRDLS